MCPATVGLYIWLNHLGSTLNSPMRIILDQVNDFGLLSRARSNSMSFRILALLDFYPVLLDIFVFFAHLEYGFGMWIFAGMSFCRYIGFSQICPCDFENALSLI